MKKMTLNGASRIVFIAGDPIVQVKSPEGMTHCFQDTFDENIVVLPAHVTTENFTAFVDGARSMGNCIGIIATIPHKICLLELCSRFSAAAKTIGAANIARFENGEIVGDQLDGQGMLAAARAKGMEVEQRSALLKGAGGAGCAIAYTLLEAGLDRLFVQDIDRTRADQLIERLNGNFPDRTIGSDPSGRMEILINATPLGMKDNDHAVFDHQLIEQCESVLDVVTGKHDTALIAAAKSSGSQTISGNEMFEGLRKPMADFLLAQTP